jgi:hypothetical protein
MFRRISLLLALCLPLLPISAVAQTPASNDNDKVIALAQKGLDDEIIIAKIKASSWKFAVDDDSLVALKKAGVPSKVVAAMLDASVITVAQVSVDGKPMELHTLGQAKVGGRLGSTLTYGIKSVKEKAFLPGPKAPVTGSSSPSITLALPKGETIDNYILVQLDKKDDRRELEVGSVGGIVGAKTGIRAESIRKTTATVVSEGNYKLIPAAPLKSGEYIVYIVGSADKIKEIYGKGYDFSVD